MKQSFLLSIIVPVHNEEACIKQFFLILKKNTSMYDCEIIFVDDGSTDNSLNLLLDFLKKDRLVKIVKLKKNFGQQIAIFSGLDCAKGDCAIVLDADLQDPPRFIRPMVVKWQKGYKIVFAQRKSRKDAILKKMTAYIFYRVYKLIANKEAYMDTGDFYLLDKKVVKNIINIPESRFFLRGIIAKETLPKTTVSIYRENRLLGETKYSTKKMLRLAFDALLQSKMRTKEKFENNFIEKIFYDHKN